MCIVGVELDNTVGEGREGPSLISTSGSEQQRQKNLGRLGQSVLSLRKRKQDNENNRVQ